MCIGLHFPTSLAEEMRRQVRQSVSEAVEISAIDIRRRVDEPIAYHCFVDTVSPRYMPHMFWVFLDTCQNCLFQVLDMHAYL